MAFPATFIPFQRALSHLSRRVCLRCHTKEIICATGTLIRPMRVWKGPGRRAGCLYPYLMHLSAAQAPSPCISSAAVNRRVITVRPARQKSTLSSNFPRRQSNTSPKSITRMSSSSSSTYLACLPSLPTSLLSRGGSKPLHKGGQVFCLQGANDPE